MFQCPSCKRPLVRFQREGINAYACASCGGSAMTVEAVRRIAPHDRFGDLWQGSRNAEAREGRRCPSCSQPMRLVRLDDARGELWLDRCGRCRLVWFDSVEMARMASESDASGPLAPASPRPDRPPDTGPAVRDLPLEARVALARLAAERIRAEAERQGDSSTEPDTPAWQMAGTVFGLPCLEGVPALAPPFVTWTLVAVMSLVTWWVMRSPDTQTLVDALGLVPDRPFRMAGLTFVTSFFVHGGVWHLVGNAYFLLVFGAPVEGILGRARYGLLLAAAALCGALAHAALDPRGTVPLVGASAGISGVIAFLVLRFPRARMGFFFWRLRWARDASGGPWIRIPAWVWFAGWLAANALGAVSQRSGCTNVSAIGHLGGVAVGVAAWAWLRRQGEAR